MLRHSPSVRELQQLLTAWNPQSGHDYALSCYAGVCAMPPQHGRAYLYRNISYQARHGLANIQLMNQDQHERQDSSEGIDCHVFRLLGFDESCLCQLKTRVGRRRYYNLPLAAIRCYKETRASI